MVDLLELVTLEQNESIASFLLFITCFLAEMKDFNATSHLPALLCGCSQACELKDKRQFVIKFLFGICFLYVWNVANI